MNHEEWRNIPGLPIPYEASSLGRIRRTDSGRVCSQSLQGNITKYFCVNIQMGYGRGNSKMNKVHRLVLMAFIGIPPKGKPCGCHNNGISKDNRPENLRWDSQKGNIEDSVKHGAHVFGERNGLSKLTNEQAISIAYSIEKSRFLVARYGVSRTVIKEIRNGTIWNRVTKIRPETVNLAVKRIGEK